MQHTDATSGHSRRLEAIICHQWHSVEGITGNQRPTGSPVEEEHRAVAIG